MASEHFAHIGSGTVPHIGTFNPILSGVFPNGRYPIISAEGLIFARKGTGAVILNFPDASIFLGLENNAISITGTAAPIPAIPLTNRRALAIANVGPGILYLGKNGVTTANGFPLAVGESIGFDIQGNSNVTIYGISDSTSDVRFLELA